MFTFNMRYPGQYYDTATGLTYNGARYYDSQLGRYIESDPIGVAGGSYSTYAYVEDNRMSGSDPSGLCDQSKSGCVPRPEVSAWICQVLADDNVGFDVARAASAAKGVREAEGGKNDNPVWREGGIG